MVEIFLNSMLNNIRQRLGHILNKIEEGGVQNLEDTMVKGSVHMCTIDPTPLCNPP